MKKLTQSFVFIALFLSVAQAGPKKSLIEQLTEFENIKDDLEKCYQNYLKQKEKDPEIDYNSLIFLWSDMAEAKGYPISVSIDDKKGLCICEIEGEPFFSKEIEDKPVFSKGIDEGKRTPVLNRNESNESNENNKDISEVFHKDPDLLSHRSERNENNNSISGIFQKAADPLSQQSRDNSRYQTSTHENKNFVVYDETNNNNIFDELENYGDELKGELETTFEKDLSMFENPEELREALRRIIEDKYPGFNFRIALDQSKNKINFYSDLKNFEIRLCLPRMLHKEIYNIYDKEEIKAKKEFKDLLYLCSKDKKSDTSFIAFFKERGFEVEIDKKGKESYAVFRKGDQRWQKLAMKDCLGSLPPSDDTESLKKLQENCAKLYHTYCEVKPFQSLGWEKDQPNYLSYLFLNEIEALELGKIVKLDIRSNEKNIYFKYKNNKYWGDNTLFEIEDFFLKPLESDLGFVDKNDEELKNLSALKEDLKRVDQIYWNTEFRNSERTITHSDHLKTLFNILIRKFKCSDKVSLSYQKDIGLFCKNLKTNEILYERKEFFRKNNEELKKRLKKDLLSFLNDIRKAHKKIKFGEKFEFLSQEELGLKYLISKNYNLLKDNESECFLVYSDEDYQILEKENLGKYNPKVNPVQIPLRTDKFFDFLGTPKSIFESDPDKEFENHIRKKYQEISKDI